MGSIHPSSTDVLNPISDLSGISAPPSGNPYSPLLSLTPSQLQSAYSTHRTARNAQQRELILEQGVVVDAILAKLEGPEGVREEGYVDPRNCLVVWARPTEGVKGLVAECQRRLKDVASNLWLMPASALHITTLEITHSHPSPSLLDPYLAALHPIIPTLINLTKTHHPRLTRPLLSYDTAGIALSFLPSTSESESQPSSYHHLRHDIYSLCTSPPPHGAGITIQSRYVVPSAHLTIARFVTQSDHDTPQKRAAWVERIEEVNDWLEREYGPYGGFEWVVGGPEGEKGLVVRKGRLWYGGGETAGEGEGKGGVN